MGLCNLNTIADFTEVCGGISGGIKKVVIVASNDISKSDFIYTKDEPLSPTASPSDTFYDAPYNLKFNSSFDPDDFEAAAVAFKVNKYASSMTSNGTYNDNGANYVTTEILLTFNGLRELYKFDSLRQSHPYIFVKLTDDTWYNTGIVGLWNRATASTVQTGAQRTDAKNMSITFSEDSRWHPINVAGGSTLESTLNNL